MCKSTFTFVGNLCCSLVLSKPNAFLVTKCKPLFFLKYPEGLRKYEYIPNFAVRGLHYDVQKVRVELPLS